MARSVASSAVALAVVVAGSAILAARHRQRELSGAVGASQAEAIGAEAYAELAYADQARRNVFIAELAARQATRPH